MAMPGKHHEKRARKDINQKESPEHVDVDFQAFPPSDEDFHGIKSLLHQIFLKANIDVTEIATTIITQNYIGNVLKSDTFDEDMNESEDTVFAIASLINMSPKQGTLQSLPSLVKFIDSHCTNSSKLQNVLSELDSRLAWLICERFINIPPQICVPMLESLLSDCEKAITDELPYNFKWYIKLCKCYKLKNSPDSLVYFTDSEDSIFQQFAEDAVTYSVATEHDDIMADGSWDGGDDDSMEPLRIILLLDHDKLLLALEEIKRQFPR